jgi:hypothetical protein
MRVSATSFNTTVSHPDFLHGSLLGSRTRLDEARKVEFAVRKKFALNVAAGTSTASQRRENARITPTDSRRRHVRRPRSLPRRIVAREFCVCIRRARKALRTSIVRHVNRR